MFDRRQNKAWWPFGSPGGGSRIHLVCLPYAGAGASVYRSWIGAVDGVEVCPLQLPGREARIREPSWRDMNAAAESVASVLRTDIPGPFAILGASMGALLGYEVARRMKGKGPVALFAAAASAPHRRRVTEPLHRLGDADFREALRRLNGTPDAVLEHAELMELLLPTLRADFELCEMYRPQDVDPLEIPIVALGGFDDASVPPDELAAWGELTSAAFDVRRFTGDHFFLEAVSREVQDCVREAVTGTLKESS